MIPRLAAAATIILLLGPALAEEEVEPSRTWTSSAGKTFEGSLLTGTDTTAKVRRSDGKTFDIPLVGLAEGDRDYVKRVLFDRQRFQGLVDGPFADKITGEWVKIPEVTHDIVVQVYGARELKRAKEPFPLFVHLHGAGARAEDVETGKVEIAPQRLASEEIYDEHPCLIVVPLCPPDTYWVNKRLVLEALIDKISDTLPIDRKRIYLSGYSMGARGIGTLLESRPEFYAAALFADGEAKMKWVEEVDTALWFTFSGERDLEGAKAVAEAYEAAGKVARFEGFPDHTHNQIHWTLAKTEGVFDWCFSQVRE